MTRETAEELLPIIKAYSEGKEIEYLNLEGKWRLLPDPSFDNEPSKYRIKTKPKYRPFKNVEECWNEMQNHSPFGWLKTKESPKRYAVFDIKEHSEWNYLFNFYLFADGTPYGIKEEE